VAFQGGVEDVLFDLFVGRELGGDLVQQRRACFHCPLGRIVGLFQQLLHLVVVVLQQRQSVHRHLSDE
jgi:hypothetical protein